MAIQLFLYDRKSRFGDAETPFSRADFVRHPDAWCDAVAMRQYRRTTVFSIIEFEIGADCHVTQGMTAFIGGDIRIITRKFWTSFNLSGDSANRFGLIRSVGNWRFVACADHRIERDAPSFDSNQGMLIASFSWAEQTAILTGSLIG